MSSDEASSGVTYTTISSNYEEPSNVGYLGVFVYRYDGLPMHPIDPPLPDYVPGPEEPESIVCSSLRVGYQTISPGYIADSDPEDESEDGPTDYLADGGDDDDDSSRDDDDSSGDDADDEDEEEASKEDEEEEHLAPADSTAAASLVVNPVPSAKETESLETDESAATPPPPPASCTTTRMSI
ncbi:hypothetical protein Tco_0581216 [Tanacetum coccineum]